MMAQNFHRILPFLVVITACILLYLLSQGNGIIPQSISAASEKAKQNGGDVSATHETTHEATHEVTHEATHEATHDISVLPGTTVAYTSLNVPHTTTETVSDPVTSDSAKLKADKTFKKRDTTRGPVYPYRETPMPILHKKDYDKLPQWDFDDVYAQNDDVYARNAQRTCPRSLQCSEDPSFKRAFTPNIRLFMNKEHLSISEWNRLSHFNNPFGFMEYNYKDVKAAVNLIPKPKQPLLLPRGPGGCVRCAVVGTGGILNGSGMGKEIDAHDYVFRMNGAVTQGYEEDVGSRTTVYVHTAHSITTSSIIFRRYGFKNIPHDEGIKYVLIPEGLRDFQWLQGLLSRRTILTGPYRGQRPWTYYAGEFDESRFYVLHPDFLRYVRNRFLKSPGLNRRYWPIVRPTNGAFTIFLALHSCDVVDAYGFMTADWSKYPSYYAERLVKNRVIFYLAHDYNIEMKLWKKLHDAKIIKLYQRKDSEKETK